MIAYHLRSPKHATHRLSTTAVPFSLGATYPSSIIAFVTITCLLTLSYVFSVQTVASVPIAYFLLIVLIASYWNSIVIAASLSRALRVFMGFWVIWLLSTLGRLVVDYGEYATLALRDALITFSFAAVPLGAGMLVRHGFEQLTKVVKSILIVVALYAWLYPISEWLPDSVRSWISIQNVSVTAVVLIAGGLWLDGRLSRVLMIASGVMALFLTQSRTMYVAAALLVAIYVITRSRRDHVSLSATSRILLVVLFAATALVSLAIIGRLGIEGRVGMASVDQVVALVRSLFDDSSELAGSRHARDGWWSDGIARMLQSPASALLGSGLGPDLANGFMVDGQLVRKPHNDFLETAIRFGLPIGIAFTSFVSAALVIGFRARSTEPVISVLLAWVLCATVNALGQPYLSYPHGAIPLAIAMGCLFVTRPLLAANALVERSDRGRPRGRVRDRRRRI